MWLSNQKLLRENHSIAQLNGWSSGLFLDTPHTERSSVSTKCVLKKSVNWFESGCERLRPFLCISCAKKTGEMMMVLVLLEEIAWRIFSKRRKGKRFPCLYVWDSNNGLSSDYFTIAVAAFTNYIFSFSKHLVPAIWQIRIHSCTDQLHQRICNELTLHFALCFP